MTKTRITRSEVVANQGPFFGGGYRATVYDGNKAVASARFDVPETHRNWKDLHDGIKLAYQATKQWLAGFGQ